MRVLTSLLFTSTRWTFDLPDGDWLAFFFNPFPEDVIERVAQRIEQSCRDSRRRVFVIFANSDRLPVLRNMPSFKRIRPRGLYGFLLKTLAPVPFEFFVVEPEETQFTLGRKARPPAEQPTHRAKART
ncbi:MAG TPA: hypothetical protein PKE02_11540 [Methyloceanibacter sp.]|nr:hypothetical protein [Methyloceanibacter sp.]